jgi:restriction endonuclease Mrr
MDPYEFEHFVADIWEQMGWETEVSSASADKGVDIIARKSRPYDQLILIQAKRYGPNSTVGSPDVQQYASLRQQYDGVDKVLIVTTNGYSRQAREIAENLNVKLIDGDGLVELIEEMIRLIL